MRVQILGVEIDSFTVAETINEVKKYVKEKKPLHLMGVNADKINLCQTNEELRKIVNNSGIINADGASVVIASKYLKKPLPERVAGIDLMMDLVSLSEKEGYTIYLLGAKEEVVKKTVEVLNRQHPLIKIVGFNNGYFTKSEWPAISKKIKEKNPDFVFVGITSPLKEYLIEFFLMDGHTSVFMGVGGSFDVLSGNIPRAPKWMQKTNLEWLFRAMQEPRRLFKRYFIGNMKFIKAVYKEKHVS